MIVMTKTYDFLWQESIIDDLINVQNKMRVKIHNETL